MPSRSSAMLLFCPHCNTRVQFDATLCSPQQPIHCVRCEKEIARVSDVEEAPRLMVSAHDDENAREFRVVHGVTIGRDPYNVVQLLDGQVSRNHARIDRGARGYVLQDTGSRNGTLVNGQRILAPHPLRPGDVIQVGPFQMEFSPTPGRRASVTIIEDRLPDPDQGVPRPAGRVPPGPTPLDAIPTPTGGAPRGGVPVSPPGGLEEGSRDGSFPVEIPDAMASICVASVDLTGEFIPREKPATRDIRQLEREYEKLLLAFRMNEELKNITSIPVLLRRAMDLVFDLFPAERGAILLVEPGGAFVPRMVQRRDEGRDSGDLRLSRTLLDQAVRERKSILTQDAMGDVGTQSVVLENIACAMTVPLLARDTLVGVLHVDSSSGSRGTFTREDLEILTGIGTQIALAIQDTNLARQVEQEQEARRRLGRYLSPVLLDRVLRDDLLRGKGGLVRRTTILFSDIRGFTSMSEKMTPEAVVDLLNEYFELMVDVVFKHEGTLDKFIGDAIMALWGVPLPTQSDALNAVRAALDMQRELDILNKARIRRGQDPIGVGIGINTGDVLVGNIGSSKRMEFTVIGDDVNIASRLCSVARSGEIVISEYTLREIAARVKVEPLPRVPLKGKAEDVQLYRVLGLYDDAAHSHDLRASNRMKLVLEVEWCKAGTGSFRPGLIENLSAGGCGLQTEMTSENAFRYNEVLVFRFRTPAGATVDGLEGRVVGVRYMCNSRSVVYYDVNVEFGSLTAEQSGFLDEILRTDTADEEIRAAP